MSHLQITDTNNIEINNHYWMFEITCIHMIYNILNKTATTKSISISSKLNRFQWGTCISSALLIEYEVSNYDYYIWFLLSWPKFYAPINDKWMIVYFTKHMDEQKVLNRMQ